MDDYTPSTTSTKQCPRCEQTKPATSDFYCRNKTKPDGLSYWCKDCAAEYRAATRDREVLRRRSDKERKRRAEYGRAYRATNAERIAEQKQEYYIATREYVAEYGRKWRAANKERVVKRTRLYYAANKGRLAARKRAYYAANADKIAERSRSWYAANRERATAARRAYAAANRQARNAITLRYRARKHNAEGNHTADDVKRQYENQRGRCYYCAVKVGDKYHVEHVIPLSRGGSNGPENIVIACAACNVSKHTKMPHEWPQGGRLL